MIMNVMKYIRNVMGTKFEPVDTGEMRLQKNDENCIFMPETMCSCQRSRSGESSDFRVHTFLKISGLFTNGRET